MRRQLVLLANLLALLLCMSMPLISTQAQSGAHISVLPAELTLDLALGNSAQLQIFVTNVVDLNAFEVIV